eukprot:160722_1
MITFNLFIVLVACKTDTQMCDNSNSDGECNIQSFFNYPIEDLQSEQIQSLINQCAHSLDTKHYFSVPHFLTNNARKTLLTGITSNATTKSYSTNIYKSIWQDKGDYDNYPSSDHARNYLMWSSQAFVGKSDLMSVSSHIINVYNYSPLLSFLKQILIKSSETHYSHLYLSNDKEGSVYGLIFKDKWVGSWHFDEHPFSCVWVLQKALYGSGSFGYVYMPPDYSIKDGWDYNLLHRILYNDTETWYQHVKTHLADIGDMYCFNGNVTLHTINPVVGPVDRVVFVTAFSEHKDFKHKHSVNEMNIWGEHNTDLHKEL